MFDAVFVALSEEGTANLLQEAAAVAWIHDAFAHCKVIGATDGSKELLEAAGVVVDDGVVAGNDAKAFFEVAASGRIWAREPTVRTAY